MATAPAFAATPNLGLAITPSAAVPIAGTGAGTLWTAGSGGGRVNIIRISQILTTTAAGIINIFVSRSSTVYLLDQYAYSATTLSSTSEATPVDIIYGNLVLDASDIISIGNTVQSSSGPTAAGFALLAMGGNF
jgi:hypothetical protein